MRFYSLIFTLVTGINEALSATPPAHHLEPRQVSGNVISSADCSGYQLNRGTWAELGIDNYLLHYPGGQNMSLTAYTRSLNILNFDCGIGKICLAGQLCHPIQGRDWVVLSAAQEWNFYMNSIYDAIATAMGMVQGTSAAMVADFFPDADDKKQLIALTVGLLSLSGVVILGFVSVLVVPILWSVLVATWEWVSWGTLMTGSGIATAWVWLTTMGGESAVAAAETSEVAATAATTAASKGAADAAEVGTLTAEQSALTGGATKLQKRSPKHHNAVSHDKFQLWSSLNANFRQLQDRLQSLISVTSELGIHSPISSSDGLYGVLQNGTFLSDHPPKATLVDNARETVQLGTLAQIFRIMNVIFVVDSAPCKQEGPTTPLKHPEAVHFCSPDGVKISLAMVRKKEINYEIRNGRLLFSKYSYSTEYLYQLAADCQTLRDNEKVNGTANASPLTMANQGSSFLKSVTNNASSIRSVDLPRYHNGNLGSTLNNDSKSSTILLPDGSSICSFPIPIFDLRKPDIKTRISAGESPAKVCRDVLQLPDTYF